MPLFPLSEEHHRYAFISIPNAPLVNLQGSGMDHAAFTWNTLDEMLKGYEDRKALGIRPHWCVQPWTDDVFCELL